MGLIAIIFYIDRYNAQGLGVEGVDYEVCISLDQVKQMMTPYITRPHVFYGCVLQIKIRMEPGKEFVKFVLRNGALVGAVLIGDTELEVGTCCN